MIRNLLTLKEAAKFLETTENNLRQKTSSSKYDLLKANKVIENGRVFFRKEDVEKLKQRKE